MQNLVLLDWFVIVGYFGVISLIAWWSSLRQNTTKDYFLAGRHVGCFAVGCSLLASNVGSEHIVGLAGQGATSGMAMAHWELHSWILVLLAYFFVPFYYRTGVFTMPEFLEKRFNAKARWILSLVSLTAYILTKVSVGVGRRFHSRVRKTHPSDLFWFRQNEAPGLFSHHRCLAFSMRRGCFFLPVCSSSLAPLSLPLRLRRKSGEALPINRFTRKLETSCGKVGTGETSSSPLSS